MQEQSINLSSANEQGIAQLEYLLSQGTNSVVLLPRVGLSQQLIPTCQMLQTKW